MWQILAIQRLYQIFNCSLHRGYRVVMCGALVSLDPSLDVSPWFVCFRDSSVIRSYVRLARLAWSVSRTFPVDCPFSWPVCCYYCNTVCLRFARLAWPASRTFPVVRRSRDPSIIRSSVCVSLISLDPYLLLPRVGLSCWRWLSLWRPAAEHVFVHDLSCGPPIIIVLIGVCLHDMS